MSERKVGEDVEGEGKEGEEGKVLVEADHLWTARCTLSPSLTPAELKTYMDFKQSVCAR